MTKTSPATSANVSNLIAELFKVIAENPPCEGAVVDLQGAAGPPRTACVD